MAKKGVSWTVFGVAMAIMAMICVAVGLMVFYLGCREKNPDTDIPSTTTTSPPPSTINYRLPRSVRPTKYRLSVQPYFPAPNAQYRPDQSFTFDGNVTITIDCTQATDNITLHMLKIALKNESIQLWDISEEPAKSIGVPRYSYDRKTQFVTFFLGSSLIPDHTYRLEISYIGQLLASDLAGLYPSSYLDDGETRWMVVTQFEPTDARRLLPCFDEPGYKAIFEVQIIHPTSLIALSNGKEDPPKNLGTGWSVTTFEPTKPMSTYLLAVAVCDFKFKSNHTRDGNVLFRVWSRPSLVNETDYAVRAGPKVLDYYADYFNISFPLQKQDMLALPDFASGAMENWGLVTYRESALLYDDRVYGSSNYQRVPVIIAHELAHQWFGDLVTMAWWDDLWLNEGFARYMEYVGGDYIADYAFRMDQQFMSNLQSAMRSDQVSTSHPIVVTVSTPDEINAIFDDISYNKGASIIRMLNYTITEPVFKTGLHTYLTRHAYDNANHNDLWTALTEAVAKNGNILDWNGKPLDVSEYMNPWIMQMGYPILNVKRQYDQSNQAVITQERYLLSGSSSMKSQLKYQESSFNYTWYVPIWYQNGANDKINFTWLLPDKPLQLTSPSDGQWLLVNYDVPGYFRVNYDTQNWRLLQDQLRRNHEKINVKNRAQLLDDAFNLARAGYLDYDITLDMTEYLINETSYVPWQSAMSGFGFLDDMLVLSSDYQFYRDYMLILMMPMYEKTGWDDTVDDQDDVLAHYLRTLSKSTLCDLGYPDCMDHATKLFQDLYFASCSSGNAMSSACSLVQPNLRRTVYCAAGSLGNDIWWNFLWDMHKKEQVAVEKDNLMYGLCCTRSPSLLTKLLDEGVNPNSTIVRRQDARYVFSYIGANDVGRVLLWPYLEENWPTISALANSGKSVLGNIITAATRSFNTPYQAKMLEDFYNSNSDQLASGATTVRQQIEKVNANVQWMRQNRDQVVRWFKDKSGFE